MNREHREGYERGETERTNFRGFRVFHGKKLQWTLPLNFLNREHREGYEQGETDHTDFCGFPCFAVSSQGHSLFPERALLFRSGRELPP